MCASFAVELLDVVGASVEEVAMVCFLVTRGESSEDQDVLVRNLIQATSLEAYPVCVFFDTEVQGLPVLPPLDVVLFDEIGTLAAVETGNHVQRLVIEGDRCMA